jgi:hypothetical protein
VVRHSRNGPLVFPVLLLVLAACGGSSESKARKAHQEIASWDATAQLTSELSRVGALPAEYIEQVEKAVTEGKEKARRQAGGSQ